MIVDIHDNDICGITLYVHEDLSEDQAERLANEICEQAKVKMKKLRREYSEHLWWKRFLNFCHTGK